MSKIHRFIDNFDLDKKEIEITGEIAHQIIKVLKLKIGEKIELSDGKVISAMAEIIKINEKTVNVKIQSTWTSDVQIKSINLFCSILKKENFELVVQKTTECGVSKIIPIITSHTVKTGLNLERLQKIAKEASEQSGRATVPEISEPIDFSESLELVKKDDLNILFDSSGELSYEKHCAGWRAEHSNSPAGEYARFSEDNSPRTNICIGPEGGWTEKEIEIAKNFNFKIASLGPLTLRGETAAIIATYLVSNLE